MGIHHPPDLSLVSHHLSRGANLIITTRVSHVLQLLCMSITFKNNLPAPPEGMAERDGHHSLIWGVLPPPPLCLQLPPRSYCQDRDRKPLPPLHMNLISLSSKKHTLHMLAVTSRCVHNLKAVISEGKKPLELAGLSPPSPPFPSALVQVINSGNTKHFQGTQQLPMETSARGWIRDTMQLLFSPLHLKPQSQLTVSEFTPRDPWLKPC